MERLQKVIAQAGVTSRRKAEALIAEGKVKVNDRIITELGTKVSQRDKIEVNNIPIEREEPIYFLFYKPTGVISALSDDKGRKVVTDFFSHVTERIFPIGRLDYDTSGALLLTNDGEFANSLMHPRYQVEKEYIVKIAGVPTKQVMRILEKGVRLEDGKTAPAMANLISADRSKNTAIISLTIHEGRNRQVRRMFEAVGHKVLKLKRERYAFLTVQSMQPGDYRQLKPHEVKRLRDAAVI